MKYKNISLMISALLILFSCGEDLVEKGDAAYQKGDYSAAIENWSIAQVRDSSLKQLNSKIALAYLFRGQEIYQRVRNVKAFDGNLVKAKELMPETISGELKQEYLKTLCDVAEAYLTTNAKNDNEKAIFVRRATNYLKNAKSLDLTLTRADSLLQGIKDDNFQKLFNTGKEYLARADRTRKVDYYFTAQKYLLEALEFDQKNPEILTMMRKIKSKTLPVLDYKDEVAMAITDIKRKEEELILTVTVMNYMPAPVQLNLDNFRLIDAQGNSYSRADQIMDVFYGDMSLKSTRLDKTNPLAEGILVFPVEDATRLYSLEYRINNDKISRKYFP